MKDLITTIASVTILLMFLLQFSANQSTYVKLLGVEHTLREFRAAAESVGAVDGTDENSLKHRLSNILRCAQGEISFNLSENKNQDSFESYDYTVTAPIYNVIGPYGFFGLSEGQNIAQYKTAGKIVFKKEPEANSENEQKSEMESEGKPDTQDKPKVVMQTASGKKTSGKTYDKW